MRTRSVALVLIVGIDLVLFAQVPIRPPGSVSSEAAQRVESEALLYGEKLADRSKVVMGTLNPTETRAFRKWDLVAQTWKREKGVGAAPLLAEGVLFDCLSRLHGVLTFVLRSEMAVEYFLDLAAERPRRADRAFQAALKIDPHLTEARFRDARIRAERDLDARKQLEQLTEEPGMIGYLAAMSRAETALALKDTGGARHWYERAVSLSPTAPSPRIGLAALSPGRPVPFDALDRTDSYYSYPCVVLTQPVDAELSRRIAK